MSVKYLLPTDHIWTEYASKVSKIEIVIYVSYYFNFKSNFIGYPKNYFRNILLGITIRHIYNYKLFIILNFILNIFVIMEHPLRDGQFILPFN